jgi:hypothetical protein
MRLLCGFSRYLFIAALPILLSCASAPPGRRAPHVLVLEGEVVVTRGAPINERIRLVTVDGESWLLESFPLEGELLELGGHRIRVWGSVSATPTTLVVGRYEMLPVDGVTPVIGTIGIDGPRLTLSVHATGERYLLTGPLQGAVRNYAGCRAWVWGVTVDGGAAAGGKCIEVRGYGVLGPGGGATVSVPADTLRN